MTATSSKLLHVQCDQAEVASVSEALINHMRQSKELKRQLIVPFKFDSTDIRFNNMGACLRTMYSSMIQANTGRSDFIVASLVRQLSALHAWGAGDLYSYFEDYLVCQGVAAYYIFILANFGECDNSALAFLGQLRFRLSKTDVPFRFVVTTGTGASANKGLLKALPGMGPSCYQFVGLNSSAGE